MKYKILTKYTSVMGKDYYSIHKNAGTDDDFLTDDVDKLKMEIIELSKITGIKNILVISDITDEVIGQLYNGDFIQLEEIDVTGLYTKAYNKIFGEKE